MNHDSINETRLKDIDTKKVAEFKEIIRNEQAEEKRKAARKPYTRKEIKAPTFASINELIEEKMLEIKAIQAEIDGLVIKRNELFFHESKGMGLIDLFSDPTKAKRLAELVEETSGKR